MTASTREWVDKAEADFHTAILARRSRKKYSTDIVCFHLQQCVEKYLKGRLVEAGLSFPKTHDLEQLLDLVIPLEPLWNAFRPSLVILSDAAVLIRYPGHTISARDATTLYKAATKMRDAMRDALGV
jgi:HEPN domain-containing protein